MVCDGGPGGLYCTPCERWYLMQAGLLYLKQEDYLHHTVFTVPLTVPGT